MKHKIIDLTELQNKSKPVVIEVSLEEVESYSTHNYSCENVESSREKILTRLNDLSFWRLTAMVRLSHLHPDDAGGQYLLELLEQFKIETLRMFHETIFPKLLYNPTLTMNPFTRQQVFDAMDEADKYDIVMSIYGENEADNTIDLDRNLRAIGNKTMDYLWQYVAQ